MKRNTVRFNGFSALFLRHTYDFWRKNAQNAIAAILAYNALIILACAENRPQSCLGSRFPGGSSQTVCNLHTMLRILQRVNDSLDDPGALLAADGVCWMPGGMAGSRPGRGYAYE